MVNQKSVCGGLKPVSFFVEAADFCRHHGEMLLNSKMLRVFSQQNEREMTTIDPEAAMKVQAEITSGERVYWAGRPNPKVIFHSDDWSMVPFSLLWGGFAIFWEAGVLGYWGKGPRSGSPSLFMAIWGIPFIIIGQYMIWGRFLYDAWLKRRTYYVLTNRRLLILQEGWKRKTNWMYLEAIPTIEREGTMTGTLWFGKKHPVIAGRGRKTRSMSRFDVGDIPVFADIDDVDGVQRLVQELRESARKESNSAYRNDPSPLSYPQD